MTSIFEPIPRWPGSPSICIEANLPAFETQEMSESFRSENGPSCKVLRVWQCDWCGLWHMQTQAPDPAGKSSGTGRSQK
jgi:hypothetical protein